MLLKYQMTIVFRYSCVTEFVYVHQVTTDLESLFRTNFSSANNDN